MKVLIQRTLGVVKIMSQGKESQFEGAGLVALLCWTKSDEQRSDLNLIEDWLIERVSGLRVFPDRDGKMNLDLVKYGELQENPALRGGILWVSQFTLGAKLESGFRPSFTDAMSPELAKLRFDLMRNRIREKYSDQKYKNIFGDFGAEMNLSFTNWGPVTIPLEK